MAEVTKAEIEAALRRVKGPDRDGNIVDLGLLSEIVIAEGQVFFSITVPAERAGALEPLRQAAEQVVRDLPGVTGTGIVLTAHSGAGRVPVRPAPTAAQRSSLPPPMQSGRAPADKTQTNKIQADTQPAQKAGLPGVEAIIAVASGKGGVGKSTTAVNLALGLQALGLAVGVLDADIYGPSVPRLLGVAGRPQPTAGNVLKPLEGYGMKVMSMGFLVEEDTPMIWRGPMVISALGQMLREVAWGALDLLVVDMPPGTGDAQLTMAQQVPLAGAVIVSTPQDLALIDARKGLNMFRKVEVPLLGIIENMSYFLCPSCGERSDIFGHGGAEAEAERLGVPFLGAVPLHMEIRARSDSGTPVTIAEPAGDHALIYRKIAGQVQARLSEEREMTVGRAPRIVME
ncbi:MAG: Mrp/NBP35 family ATP-binding protein [Rhodospirillales bacterium]|nr:Mrp/NBP35 family ATP-binding protein [Rhodospirillales bacterium]